MPLYTYACPWGHTQDAYVPSAEHRHCRTVLCASPGPGPGGACAEGMQVTLSVGRGLTWIEEARPMVLQHLSHTPVTVRSWSEWSQQVRAHGCEWVGARYGEKGCWV